MKRKTPTLYKVIVFSLSLCILLATGLTLAKSGKSNRDKVKDNLKGYEKPTKGAANAAIHSKKIKDVVQNLQDVANDEETLGNEDVSDDIDDVADTEDDASDDVVDSIDAVETRGKWRQLLFGGDYNNLGHLRSSLVHTRNRIRKLTRNVGSTVGEGSDTVLQEQLTTLTQERERIKDVITENESKFSILGWVFKFLSGYQAEPIDGQDEDDLIDDVADVVDDTETPDDTSDDVGDTGPGI